MIQELLGVVEERKMSIPESLLLNGGSSPASFPSSPASLSSQSSLSSSSEPQQNLRCPRCDSSNTKFCYYNNYNLTQPRHFCKTCRRYWTKGGALRNVPIGGGCRKARPSLATASVRQGRARAASPDVVMARLDQEHMLPASSPIMWATPYSSQLLALLRASQVQNTNPNPSPIPSLNYSNRMKDEGALFGSHVVGEANGGLKEHGLSLDPLGQLWRNGNGQYAYQHQQLLHQQQQQHNMVMGDVQSSGIQELLQRRRSSVNCHHNDQFPTFMSNVGSSAAVATAAMATSGTTASIMEPTPLTGGDFGYWNPAVSWADVPPTNGAFL